MLKRVKDEEERWEKEVRLKWLEERPETKGSFSTLSGYPVKPLYTPDEEDQAGYLREIGFPGEYPFTRGRTPNGYRSF